MNPNATTTENSDQPATFLFRLFAHLIDAGLVGLVGNTIIALIRHFMGGLDPQKNLILITLTFLVSPFLMFFYSGYFYSAKGRTIGKMILGLEVRRNGNPARLEFWRGGLRDSIGKTISLLVAGIGFLLILFRPDKRALHDLMFESEVRKVKPIKPMLVIAGLFTAILSYQFSQWNGSFLQISAPKVNPSTSATVAPSAAPSENSAKAPSTPVAPQSSN
jgi:uncharacterized RDD family membrane protein YckC